MGGPNPGIIGNIKITAIDGEDVTFLIPRYCAINPLDGPDPGGPYFIPDRAMTMHAIEQKYGEGKTSSFDAYVMTEATDYSMPGDIVSVTISAENGVLPPLAVGDLFSVLFINQYAVEPNTD